MGELHLGDCLDVMRGMQDNSVDAVITDPPYGLGFMGKDWDHGIPGMDFWEAALRVAKPGATLLAFGGTRTFHRLACAIEDAGWEIRDTIMWVYGSGFPKSHNISKAIDREAGAERVTISEYQRAGRSGGILGEKVRITHGITAPATPAAIQWDGWGTALKPAWEPIIVAMKPCDGTFAQNALAWGVAGLWIDGARVGTNGGTAKGNQPTRPSNGICGNGINGGGVVALNYGRWPANLIHDGSDEVLAGFPEAGSFLKQNIRRPKEESHPYGIYGSDNRERTITTFGDAGSAARFFYCAKASRAERERGLEGMEARQYGLHDDDGYRQPGERKANHTAPMPSRNHHPTVKPLALMVYLCRLTMTPTGGVVLDPFMGSGTTGIAAVQTGRDFIGIELDPAYYAIAEQRIEEAQQQPALMEAGSG